MRTRTKLMLVERAKAHQKADEIIQHKYWDGHKGCAVGCLAHVDDDAHGVLNKMTNIPEWVFHTADDLHESLLKSDFKKWPVQFIDALPVGRVNWTKKHALFIITICDELVNQLNKFSNPSSGLKDTISFVKKMKRETKKVYSGEEKGTYFSKLDHEVCNRNWFGSDRAMATHRTLSYIFRKKYIKYFQGISSCRS